MGYNVWSDVSGIANKIQEDAYFVMREVSTMQGLIKTFNDAQGMNPRIGYEYNQGTAQEVSDADDLTSSSFTPSAGQTLTPKEIGLQFFVSDARARSELPENIMTDASRELGLAAADKVESDLIGLLNDLTGGTVGTAGTAIVWGHVSAAIARARSANKSNAVPLACVIHGYQWQVLAKAASVAGSSSVAQAAGFTEEMTRRGFVSNFMGVPMYQVYAAADTDGDFYGGVFPRDAIAIDWRKPITIEIERDASRRGYEINMSAIYAVGLWRPALGITLVADATAPTV